MPKSRSNPPAGTRMRRAHRYTRLQRETARAWAEKLYARLTSGSGWVGPEDLEEGLLEIFSAKSTGPRRRIRVVTQRRPAVPRQGLLP